ncbi:MAG: DUF368 domain-containing protein, partial [Flavobacteriales bacterium]|nr:DUF368 domain-containing protein [Flavobacteriales bacterium]
MIKQFSILYLKGLSMGAVDIIPGVSGGTIAFITGIYEELIKSLKSIDLQALKLLFTGKLRKFWAHINGTFLLVLFLGIATSVFSLAKVIKFLLTEYPILLWGFFFGLIIASAFMIARTIEKWTIQTIVAITLGGIGAYLITILTPATTPETTLFTFGAGMIAICAMILPGISGSFLLLMMKQYERIVGALTSFDLEVILTFGSGAVLGLVLFSKVLSWLFKKFHDVTIALLTGIMFGSLNTIWPWKEVLETRVNSHGETVPLVQV